MSKYVPPGRREQSKTTKSAPTSEAKQDNCFTLEEISNHFWPIEDAARRENATEGRTLHDAAATPGRLAYVILFNRANPRWDTDGIVFTKSNLDLLPGSLADARDSSPHSSEQNVGDVRKQSDQTLVDLTKNTGRLSGSAGETCEALAEDAAGSSAIAVFKQVLPRQDGRSFKFEGWYVIERVAFLEPRSSELARMLEQKWSRQDQYGNVRQAKRDEAKWNESLRHRWTVVKLSKNLEAAEERGAPVIERLPDKDPEALGGPRKSVNEMLAEMRGQN